jgi:molybdopterin converting factor small subunit
LYHNPNESMRITIRLFAAHREAAGRSTLVVHAPEGSSIADVFALVCRQVPNVQTAARSAAFARNLAHASADDRVAEGDEIAILPPVAGG